MFPQHLATRTQDLEPAYHDAGQFYWGRSAAWRAGTSPLAGGRGLLLPPERAVDIDTPADWARAEALFAQARRTGPVA
jgi:pseudaminic acid cytidylyltransferase